MRTIRRNWVLAFRGWVLALHDCFEVHDLVEEFWNPSKTKLIDVTAVFSYIVGSTLYILGSVYFLPQIGKVSTGAWAFIFGSILFLLVAVLNCMQIFESTTMWIARFDNLTAACYIIGSTMFLCASVP